MTQEPASLASYEALNASGEKQMYHNLKFKTIIHKLEKISDKLSEAGVYQIDSGVMTDLAEVIVDLRTRKLVEGE